MADFVGEHPAEDVADVPLIPRGDRSDPMRKDVGPAAGFRRLAEDGVTNAVARDFLHGHRPRQDEDLQVQRPFDARQRLAAAAPHGLDAGRR